ncbi:unnamed protein product, partial [Prorocentrum cordatum]
GAEQFAETGGVDRAVTWNNMACCCRRVGKIRAAVNFLKRAPQAEEHRYGAEAAQTHLNLRATLSQLRCHDAAIFLAQCAPIRVYEMLSPSIMVGELGGAKEASSEPKEAVTALCIAYHNLSGLAREPRPTNITKSSIEAIQVRLPAAPAAPRRAVELPKRLPGGDRTMGAHADGVHAGAADDEFPKGPAAAEAPQA